MRLPERPSRPLASHDQGRGGEEIQTAFWRHPPCPIPQHPPPEGPQHGVARLSLVLDLRLKMGEGSASGVP
jgi:hypothetical protein